MKKSVLIALTLIVNLNLINAQDFTKHGIASFNQENTLQKGDKAVLFEGKNQSGDKVILEEKLSEGPVVLIFYRGYWCPHCSRYLNNYQDSLDILRTYGAKMIAVSPEPPSAVSKTKNKTEADFPVISDESGKIMKAYGVDFEVKSSYNAMIRVAKGVDLRDYNKSSDKAELPIPATYIINKKGKIIYLHFDPDYTSRASVNDMIEVFDRMK